MKKAYSLWSKDPFHPSIHFKCINNAENIWSFRVTLGYRAIGVLDEDTGKYGLKVVLPSGQFPGIEFQEIIND